MILIYNEIGCGVFITSLAVALGTYFGLGLITSSEVANQVACIVAGGMFLAGDGGYRLSHFKEEGWRRIFLPATGGHLYFIPCWVIGLLIFSYVLRQWLTPLEV